MIAEEARVREGVRGKNELNRERQNESERKKQRK